MLNYTALVIDLDDSLIATDTLWESIILFLKSSPLRFFLIFVWILKGKKYFKYKLAHEVIPDPTLLPYNQDVLEYITEAKASGLSIILATAANQRIADNIANYLGIFSKVLASDINTNLLGKNKLKAIKSIVGEEPFGYIGDASVDIPLWEAASTAILVNPYAGLIKKIKHHSEVKIMSNVKCKKNILAWVACLRVHQWFKNILLFMPTLMAHRIFELSILIPLACAFISFSFSTSAIYILNDLLDLEDDRQHPTKKYRPLASGRISIRDVILVLPLLLIISFVIAFFYMPFPFRAILILYIMLTTLYSFVLKKKVLADVIFLAGLYTLRIIAGSAAVNVPVSSWLLAFAMFFFLSLAIMKRYADLLLSLKVKNQIKGRGYLTKDLEVVLASGITSGQLALLVLALYINNETVALLYKQPGILWFIIPCLFYWISRMWIKTHRGEMTSDPITFTFKDDISYIVAIIVITIIIAAALIDSESIPFLKLFYL